MRCVKRWLRLFVPVLALAVVHVFAVNAILADVIFSPTGVSPAASSDWNSSTNGYVGLYDAGGTVTVNGGSTLESNGGYVGNYEDYNGYVQVDGSGSLWASRYLGLGLEGFARGTLEISNGGSVTVGTPSAYGYATIGEAANSQGEVIVDGPGSLFESYVIRAGWLGNGTLLVRNGGTVHSSGQGIIGEQSGSSGTATVDGSGSLWQVDGELKVGNQGAGVLKIQNGGSVSAGSRITVGTNSMISFGVGGGTLSTPDVLYVSQLTGSGEIHANNGLVSNLDVTFDNSATATVAFGTGGTLTVSGNRVLGTGYGDGAGSLTIKNGSNVNTSFAYLGYHAGASTSSAIVDGSGTTWTIGNTYVGYYGSATLEIANGAVVESLYSSVTIGDKAGSSGTLTVTDSDSRLNLVYGDLKVGSSGDGTLNIYSGGAISVGNRTEINATGTIDFDGGSLTTKDLYMYSASQLTGSGEIYTRGFYGDVDLTFDNSALGTLAFGTGGTLTVDMSATNSSGDLAVGHYGNGTLMIRNGADVYTRSGYLGYEFGSSGTATVDGAKWTCADWVSVGEMGEGVLNITGGGTVSSAEAYIACDWYMAGTSASVNVTGANSMLIADDGIYVGYFGNGTVNVENGGAVETKNIILAGDGVATGTLNFDGGILRSNGANSDWLSTWGGAANIYVKAGGATFDTAGYDMGIAMDLQTHGTSTGGGITKTGDGTLALSGANTYTGLTTVEAGTLALGVGAQDPVLTLGGGADVQQDGTLIFDYSGVSVAETVRNALSTGLIHSSDATGSRGLGFSDNAVDQVTVVYTLFGDSNLDGSVNGTDLNAVLSYYNQSGQFWGNGDFNYDGSVNGTDLNTVLSNYNQSLSSSTAAVPEPSTLLLMVLGLVGLLAVRRVRGCMHR